MIAAAVLLLVAQASAVDAERAFDAAAARDGQWTAFREYADPGAIMFVPQPVNAPTWLRRRANPPRSVRWQPAASFVACDGRWAANTGSWQRPDGSIGYFTTIWHRGSGGRWRWVLDHGDTLMGPRAVPAQPVVRHAACGGVGRQSLASRAPGTGTGLSADATLRWRYQLAVGGFRAVTVELWNGHGYDHVINDTVLPPG